MLQDPGKRPLFTEKAIREAIIMASKEMGEESDDHFLKDFVIQSETPEEMYVARNDHLYTSNDYKRRAPLGAVSLEDEEYRTPWRRDYARLIGSPAFRRLQGKVQLFPGAESDYFRNRLTHSIEVAQIAKAMAIRINNTKLCQLVEDPDQRQEIRNEASRNRFFEDNNIDLDVVEIAALAHDLGHPPFGHNGEAGLHEALYDAGGIGFEGNAQTLRVLTHLEKRSRSIVDKVVEDVEKFDLGSSAIGLSGNDLREGLNFTYRVLASILKYPNVIQNPGRDVVKGFYPEEQAIVEDVKKMVLGNERYQRWQGRTAEQRRFRTVECWIMDVADDVAYSMYDLDDAFKAGFLKPTDFRSRNAQILKGIAGSMRRDGNDQAVLDSIADVLDKFYSMFFGFNELFLEFFKERQHLYNVDYPTFATVVLNQVNEYLVGDDRLRTLVISGMVGFFVRELIVELDEEFPCLSKVTLSEEALEMVQVVKYFTFHFLTLSSRMRFPYYRQKGIVRRIFTALSSEDGYMLMSDSWRQLYRAYDPELNQKFDVNNFQFMSDQNEVLSLGSAQHAVVVAHLVGRYRKELQKRWDCSANAVEDESSKRSFEELKNLLAYYELRPKRLRVLADYIACMTDRQALEFYARIESENPQTIFKFLDV